MATTIGELVALRTAIEASGRSMVLVVAPDKSTVVPSTCRPATRTRAVPTR